MKVAQKDMPKVMLLVILIGGCLIYIGVTVLNTRKAAAAEAAQKSESASFVGTPTQVAALEPTASPQQYVEQIESWSKPPAAPIGDPFREVLPQDILRSINAQKSHQPAPAPQITGNGFQPMNPTTGLPDARIDFPMVTVQGVVVDTSDGNPTNFATISIDGKVYYAKAGDVIGNDLVVKKVSQLGAWIRAAKEEAFIEVSKSYKPTGMAPPAPPKPAATRRHTSRHSR